MAPSLVEANQSFCGMLAIWEPFCLLEHFTFTGIDRYSSHELAFLTRRSLAKTLNDDVCGVWFSDALLPEDAAGVSWTLSVGSPWALNCWCQGSDLQKRSHSPGWEGHGGLGFVPFNVRVWVMPLDKPPRQAEMLAEIRDSTTGWETMWINYSN